MIPSDVEGLISEQQGQIIQDYVRQMTPGLALEVGSFRGRSACYIASAMPPGSHLYCVDAWQDSKAVREKRYRTDVNFEAFLNNVASCGLADLVTPIRALSSEVIWDRPLSLLSIDAGHDYDEVLSDIDRFAPHVIRGGVILFDDYSTAFPGVERAVDERFSDLTLHRVKAYDSRTHGGHQRYLAVARVL